MTCCKKAYLRRIWWVGREEIYICQEDFAKVQRKILERKDEKRKKRNAVWKLLNTYLNVDGENMT